MMETDFQIPEGSTMAEPTRPIPPQRPIPPAPKDIRNDYTAAAQPTGDGQFYATFHAPGLQRDFVFDVSGERSSFPTQEAAIAAASFALCERLNTRVFVHSTRYNYKRISASQFATSLGQLSLSPADWAWMHGNKQDTVMRWIDGAEEIPSWVGPALASYHVPEALDAAWAAAEASTAKKERNRR